MNDPEHASINEDEDNEFLPPRRRVSPVMLTSIIVLVVLIVAGGIFATTRFVGGSANATPTPTLVPGSNLFYIQTSPGWGTVFVDGQKLAHVPGSSPNDLPLQLSAGVHQVSWQADLFTQKCTIIVPPVLSETKCLANDPVTVPKGPNKGLFAYLISFTDSFGDLTAAQRQPLYQAAQKAIDGLQSSDIVQPGEQYADLNAPQFIATATSTLRGTLRYQLDTSTSSQGPCAGQFLGFGSGCSLNGQDCHLFCSADQTQAGQPANATPDHWDVFGIVRSSWTYTTLSGQVVAQNQPNETDNSGTEFLINLFVAYNNGQWQVSTKTPDNPTGYIAVSPSCEAASNLVTQTASGTYTNITLPGDPNDTIEWNPNDGSNAAAGCLLAARAFPRTNNPATPTPTPKPFALCLYRFGVLLALDNGAHSLWPNLPLADAYEKGIAQRIPV